jgi:multidrug efflux system membrane fusion protein
VAKRNSVRTILWVVFCAFGALGLWYAWSYYHRTHQDPGQQGSAPVASTQTQTSGQGQPASSGRRRNRQLAGDVIPVMAVAAKSGEISVSLNALGTVTPLSTVTVRPQLSGYLTQVAFTEGQLVKKGDFLAQIDPRPYQIALEQAQGQLARDQALWKNAQIDLARYQKLNAQDSIARQQLDTQQSLVLQYQGTILSDQAQVDTAKLDLDYCHITSPVTGRIGLRQVDQGNYVQTSDANGLVVVTQLQPISVIFTIPEDNIPLVQQEVSAGHNLIATVYDRSNTNKLATGTLSTLDNQIDTTTGTVKLRAQFDNTHDELFPNQFVNVVLLVKTEQAQAIVPMAAIQHGPNGAFVYHVKQDNTVAMQAVNTGITNGDNVEILSGLTAGDKVVVDGVDQLREGSKVIVSDAARKTDTADSAKPSKPLDAPAN